ncbi:MAG: hypothetical protein HC921_16615 [Synechococcaceae cyanobacterium SM2_3_1]|nr:hypothetical protein [Synechococcaceae cyanobacterium SM2_3_1]
MWVKSFQFIGSIRMAVPLLAVITFILMTATIYESQVGSLIVQRQIYKSYGFGLLMLLLVINLSVSALSRYPWKGSRRIGFALTHLGLVTLIIGAAGVIHLGTEGLLGLRVDAGPLFQARMEGDQLEVIDPAGHHQFTEVLIKPDGQIQPDHLGEIALTRYSNSSTAITAFEENGSSPNPAVQLQLSSLRMGQDLQYWLAATPMNLQQLNIGPATFQLISTDSQEHLDSLLHPLEEDLSIDNLFQVLISPAGDLYYLSHSAQGLQSGPFPLRTPVSPGWADFEITGLQHFTHARGLRKVIPTGSAQDLHSTPALQLQLPDQQEQWIAWGEPAVLGDPEQEYLASFSPRLLDLPFAVALKDFIVDFNEGAESVAMWTSRIQILDPHNGRIEQRDVWMNHPTWYRGWKIAQASWNPDDFRQSTLQVKREPLWITALTWGGSALVVLGIAVMFYGNFLLLCYRRWIAYLQGSTSVADPVVIPSPDLS